MYDRSELQESHRLYWQLIRRELQARGVACPPDLSVPEDLMSHWQAPGLVLSQTCGLPYRRLLHGRVALIGTPDFGVEGCAPGYYRSAIVVRAGDTRRSLKDFAGAVFALNQFDSQSGYAAAYHHGKAQGVTFTQFLETGAHALSVSAILRREADIAAIDAVTWALLQQYDAAVDGLSVLEYTTPTPGLPYIASASADVSATFNAVTRAIEQLPVEHRQALRLNGLVRIPEQAYLAVPNPTPSVRMLGNRV
jgi:ABC-type phosphate/phosphonate transport system substrate-binding protein